MSYFDRDEYCAESSVLIELRRIAIEKDAKSGMWTTKDGTRIPLEAMTDNHLLNAYRVVVKNNVMDMLTPWVVALKKEMKKRGLNGCTD